MMIDLYRPSLNMDINRNACTFNTPKDLLTFIDAMKKHPLFGGLPGTVLCPIFHHMKSAA